MRLSGDQLVRLVEQLPAILAAAAALVAALGARRRAADAQKAAADAVAQAKDAAQQQINFALRDAARRASLSACAVPSPAPPLSPSPSKEGGAA